MTLSKSAIVRLWEQTKTVEEFARALESRVLAERKPVYQRREKHAWVDTSKLGYEHWPEDQRRILFTHPTPDDAKLRRRFSDWFRNGETLEFWENATPLQIANAAWYAAIDAAMQADKEKQ